MRLPFYLTLILLTLSCSYNRTTSSCDTFEELQDSSGYVDGSWENVPKRLQVSFASIDKRYPKKRVPDIDFQHSWEGIGWKGERISAQLILWTSKTANRVSLKFSDFKSANNNKLSSDIAQARFVRYVMTDSFGEGCDAERSPEKYPASLSPDMLDILTCFNIHKNTVRPVWISINIPAEAEADIYEGSCYVLVNGRKVQKLNLKINVQDQLLPPPSMWTYHLDLWQHPTAVARWHNVELWSDEHFQFLEPVMKMLAHAGQKVITVNLNKDPWNGQCYDRYADMIKWEKKADGTWSYDYTNFDRWVTFMMELGINKMINCYSMVPWNHELDYWDEETNTTMTVQAVPGTTDFVELWSPFLKDFSNHLVQKQWLNITNIAMDERSPEMMKATINLVKEVAPDLGISLADNHKSYKEYPFIKDLCVKHGTIVEKDDLKYRKENGLNTTYYAYCGTKFPNQFTFSLPTESVYSAWYSFANGFDGFLRWAYNSWVENPLLDSRYSTWPAGDTYLVYPDARSSIRFERLREGIQDVEKVRIIQQQLENSTKKADKEKLQQLKDAIDSFSPTREYSSDECIKLVNNAKGILREVSNNK